MLYPSTWRPAPLLRALGWHLSSMLLLSGALAASAQVGQADTNQWHLVWADEFDKPGLPDSTKWNYEDGFVRNAEPQYYTRARQENARVENGILIIEAQEHRSQERNRAEALARLVALVRRAAVRPKRRIATRPTKASKTRRLDAKTRRGRTKVLRSAKPSHD
jgi:hypothetical protein